MRRITMFAIVPIILVGITIVLGSEQEPKTGIENWAYPEAKRLKLTSGAGLTVAAYATSDDIEKVLKFYGKKLGQKLSGDDSVGAGGVAGDGQNKTGTFNNSFQPFDANAKVYPRRGVAMHVATQDTKEHTITIVITRVPGESHTHIAMTYVKR